MIKRLKKWRWKKQRQKLEYNLFASGDTHLWFIVMQENKRLGVWK